MARTAGLTLLCGIVLAGCNLPEPAQPTAPAAGILRGTVWSDQCRVEQGEACLGAEASPQPDGLREVDEPGIPGVRVDLGEGPCPSRGLDQATTGPDGGYAFIGHGPAEYCVSLDLQDPQVAAALPPGRLTSGEAHHSVALEAGQDLSGLDFGWAPIAPAVTETPAAVPTLTPTLERAEVTARVNANCRSGPGIEYPVLAVLPIGELAEAIGRSSAADWLQVRPDADQTCWLSVRTVETNFHAGDLPIVAAPPTPTPAPAAIEGRVWHDQCSLRGGQAGSPPTPSPGCLRKPDGTYAANGVHESGEPGLVGVLVNLGEGECPTRGLASTITAREGVYQFGGLAAGTYCVSVDPTGAINSSILVPGEWTRPPGVGEITIVLTAGERLAEVNFGWDYQFLP